MSTSFWQEQIAFGSLRVPRIMAAPLDGITDSPMRRLIRDFSPNELLFTEMRHIASVANSRKATMFTYAPKEQPLAFQISANTTRWIEKAVEKIVEHKFVMLNLNMGCPAKQVVKSGSGSALMANIPLFKEILQVLQKVLRGRIPLTIKIRAGFKTSNGLEIAQIAEDLGVEGIIIHPRLQTGAFSSSLDYNMVAQIKKYVRIPLIFSGNINSFKRVQKVHALTGVDGFMIGRALWGCPWKMQEITQEAQDKTFSLPQDKVITIAHQHLRFIISLYGPHGVHYFKKQLPQYIRRLPGAAQLRAHLLRLQSSEEMENELCRIRESV